MSADLELYAVPDDPEIMQAWWDYNHVSSVGDMAGGDWFDTEEESLEHQRWVEEFYGPGFRPMGWDEWNRLTYLVRGYEQRDDDRFGEGFPHIWIGQVSTLKAGLLGDAQWIPGPVEAMWNVLGDFGGKLMTPSLRAAMMVAMNQPNNSYYGRRQWVYNVRQRDSDGHLRYPTARKKRNSPVGYYPPGRGIQKRQVVRRWCDANMGRRIYWSNE